MLRARVWLVGRIILKISVAIVFAGVASAPISAKESTPPAQVINWPATGSTVVRISLGKFKEISSVSGQRSYVSDTTAENLWGKKISHISFMLYLYDKNKARIGDGWITLDNAMPGQAIKFQTFVRALGTPVSVDLTANSVPPELQPLAPAKKVSLTINSVPQGATLSVDGTEVGSTPKVVQLAVGKHSLEFSKAGFSAGKFPVEISPDDASGGSVSYELGTSAHDTFELRDGTVQTGDLVSVSGMELQVRVAGAIQTLDRNRVKRILLTEREPASN